MKIKKVLLSLLLAVFVLPCLAILSACGEKTVTGFQVYVDDKLVAENSNVKISTTYGDVLDLADRITVKLVYDDKSTEIITKGTSGYTLTGVPEKFDAGSYSLEVGYGDYSNVEITLEIAKKEITKPTISGTFTYNGAEQTALAPSDYYTITNNTRTDAGTQNVGVAIKDKANFIWADETNTDLSLSWTINQATPIITKAPDSVAIESGDELTNDLIQNATVKTSSTSSTELQGTWAWKTAGLTPTVTGNQTAVFTPTNGNYSAIEVNVNVVVITYIQKPIISGTFTYNGTEQTALEASEYYTITNNTRTNAGTQNVGVALKDKTKYMWADETNTDLSLSWTINKATPVITENPDSVTIESGDELTNDLIQNATVKTSSTSSTELQGTWAWKTENLKPTTTGNQIAVFTPTDTNYKFIEVNINVTISVEVPQGVLEKIGLSGINGIFDETFNYWTANNNEFVLQDAELTIQQFNALIAQLNSIYNIGNSPLSPWANDTNYDPSDTKGITNHKLTTNDFIYSYINDTITNEYFIKVLAYRINNTTSIHIQKVEVKVNEMKITYTNNSNLEDKLVLFFNSEFDAGTATWGELNGTFTIDLENKGLLNINFGENSATGAIDPNNAHILFNYLTAPYEFTKVNKGFDFIDEVTQLGFYDIYNSFITNKKIQLEMNFSEEGYTNKYVITEWQVGTNSYVSTQITLYTENKDGEQIFLKSYEEIYDITNEKVYIFYSERTFMPNNPYNYYYKELTFTDFATKLQTIDSTFETMELWIEDSKISPMFFANFMTKGTWTEQDFIDNLNNIGKININNVWYNVETYNTDEGETSLFIKDGKLVILEGDLYSSPTFSFTNPKTDKTARENSSNIQYVDWEDTAFDEYIAELYAVE